ncbi:hypothetical protein JAAARDRAFT_40225 [Jaapia argillacea MUCL 33604]|uniref:Uncharacterized protein n=1 Tax=Jaapia argillacea MUCL 33604 TaxID=933084 RepID=A0A067PCY5_9AGAM|nr:hypothetical protein JAAARDRAFT_40225 [Jaapia argillacea MUCL 33604]
MIQDLREYEPQILRYLQVSPKTQKHRYLHQFPTNSQDPGIFTSGQRRRLRCR